MIKTSFISSYRSLLISSRCDNRGWIQHGVTRNVHLTTSRDCGFSSPAAAGEWVEALRRLLPAGVPRWVSPTLTRRAPGPPARRSLRRAGGRRVMASTWQTTARWTWHSMRFSTSRVGSTSRSTRPRSSRHHARHLRTARFHRPAGGPGAQDQSQPDTLARRIRPQQPASNTGETGQGNADPPSNSSSVHTERPKPLQS